MATKSSDASHHADDGAGSGSKKPSSSQSQKRTRTKTGCLTCRKRRIKCDEGQPVCANCIRSRRQCEGYKTPLVFRSSEPASFAVNQYTTNTLNAPTYTYYQHGAAPTAYSGIIYPHFHGQTPPQVPPPPPVPLPYAHPATFPYIGPPSAHIQAAGPHHGNLTTSPHVEAVHGSGTDYFTDPPQVYGNTGFQAQHPPSNAPYPGGQVEPHSGLGHVSTGPPVIQPGFYQHSHASHVSSISPNLQLAQSPLGQVPLTNWNERPFHQYGTSISLPSRAEHTTQPPTGIVEPSNEASDDSDDQDVHAAPHSQAKAPQLYRNNNQDIYFYQGSIGAFSPYNLKRSTIRDRKLHTDADQSTPPDVDLIQYLADEDKAILNDPYTKIVFQQYIGVTGAMLTSFDRTSLYDGPIVNQELLRFCYPGLWTYTLPTMSLKHGGLLHSLLAHASFQLAQRNGSSTTPARKHYAQAWRRVHRDVRDPQKRRHLATFAATLCLAFYEVATADHSRWNMHLSGAAQLIREMDLSGMSTQLRWMSKNRNRAGISDAYSANSNSRGASFYHMLDQFYDFETDIVSGLIGEPLHLDNAGNLWRESQRPEAHRSFGIIELTNYETYRDVFFWYLRQDVIHALVGGTDLLLDFMYWTDCPPRAPLRHGMSPHGAFDHFILLMGRLMHWIKQDRRRKKRQFHNNLSMSRGPIQEQNKAQSGRQKSSSTPSSARASTAPAPSKAQPPQLGPAKGLPTFYGMTPNQGSSQMFSAFQSTASPTPESELEEADFNLEESTEKAFKEWASIRQAFDLFEDAVGVDYEPLSEQNYPSFDTPFGSALLYRSHGIASLMAWYNMGLLALYRAHPSMPPFATIAIGAAAQQTAAIAVTIGRIVAGIKPDLSQPPLRPADAGVFSDIALPFFLAAVQYRDAEQRAWAIDWHCHAENVTGSASIGVCAHGCESAWTVAAEMGRGPPYQRTMGINITGVSSETTNEESDEGPGSEGAELPRQDGSNSLPGAKDSKRNFILYSRGQQTMKAFALFTDATNDMARLSADDQQS